MKLVGDNVTQAIRAQAPKLTFISYCCVTKRLYARNNTTKVNPFIAFHAEVLLVCSLRRHHICVTATREGPGIMSL